MIEQLIPLINKTAINEVQKELTHLYEIELFERQTYSIQIERFEGLILEVLKDVSEQEEHHANILKKILNKVGIIVIDEYDKIPLKKATGQLKEALEYDIKQEEISAKDYQKTISIVKDENLKTVLEHILSEEFSHLGILEKYLETGKY